MNDLLHAFAVGLAERLKDLLPPARLRGVDVTMGRDATYDKATIDIQIRPPMFPCPAGMNPHLWVVRIVAYADGPVKIGTMNRRKIGHYDFHRLVNLWSGSSVDRIVEAVLDQVPDLKVLA